MAIITNVTDVRVDNRTVSCLNCTLDIEEILPEANLWCLLLILFPVTCIFGNSLVVMAVWRERSLQTSTNFLLVSLAIADMLVAAVVMPFAVYLTVNRLYWFLPDAVCNFFCVVDVSASTSSIVHLVAISVDRFYAVVRHMEYKSSRHKKRVYFTILFCWAFSATIGLPLGIGLNQGAAKEKYRCGIVNPKYMLYSSIFAFYIPCMVMIIMYSFVFYRLHRRLLAVRLQEMAAGRIVNFGGNLGGIVNSTYCNNNGVNSESPNWALPFLKTIEQTIANLVENDELPMEEIDELTAILQTLETDKERFANGSVPTVPSLPLDGMGEKERLVQNSHIGYRIKRRLNSIGSKPIVVFFPKNKIRSLKDRAIELLMRMKSKQGIVIRKETRATKLVATVMIIFLVCYTPFFTTNIVKVFKLWAGTWTDDMEETFIIFTWFGYINSCLNPAVYSFFNRTFRAAFQKLIFCPLCANQINSPNRKVATANLYHTTFQRSGSTRDQNRNPNDYNAQLIALTNSIQMKFQRRTTPNSKTLNTLPVVPEMNSSDKNSNSVSFTSCNSNYPTGGVPKKADSVDSSLDDNLRMATPSSKFPTDESFLDLSTTTISCYFFTEAIEV